MKDKYRVRKATNGHQWYVEFPYENKYKIEFVCYSESRANEYVTVQKALMSAMESTASLVHSIA